MRWLLSFTILIAFGSFAAAQCMISGTVRATSGEMIEFASVVVFPLSDSTAISGDISNETGAFLIEITGAGDYQLTIQMLGYTTLEKTFEAECDLQLGELVLEEEAALLDVIEVVAEKSTIESGLGKKTLRLGKDLSGTGDNAFEVLENIPIGNDHTERPSAGSRQ